MFRPFRLKRNISLALACSAALLSCAGASVASASSPIEGVWSFNGGAVDMVGQPNGTLDGIVTVQTKFAQCFHPVEEEMWVEVRPLPDGSYQGFHRWYFEPASQNSSCTVNPTLGPTAWRVLENGKGEHFLRVCFSEPGSSSQPAIAANGTSTNVTYGCVDSAAIAPLPTVTAKEGAAGAGQGQISFRESVLLPGANKCVRARTLRIRLHNPKYDPFKEVVVWVNGKKRLDIRGTRKLAKTIVLKHLPRGTYKLKVLAITVLDQRLSGKATYQACKKTSGKIKLHHSSKPKH